MQFAQDEHLMKTIRQAAHRARDEIRVVGLQKQGFGIGGWPGVAVALLVEFVGRRGRSATPPVGADIPNDSEKPGPAVAASKCSEVSKRPERRLLHDIFGVVLVPHQPARQPIGRVEVRDNDVVKALGESECCPRSKFIIHGESSVAKRRYGAHRQRSHGARTAPVQSGECDRACEIREFSRLLAD
jgi:hypothetical protein